MSNISTSAISKIEDSKYFYSKKVPIKYYEMDFKRNIKPSGLLNILQDMATENAEMLNFGPSFIFERGFAWFLVKYHMEFDNYPSEIDELIIKTEARGYSKIIAHRDFEIWNADNTKRLGRIASNWMLIDLETKRPLSLSKVIDYMPAYEKRESDLEFAKVLPPEKIDFEKTYEIRYDDIDVNQHVNNANYIVWALEALPYEFKQTKKIKSLDIVYKKEIVYGYNIISQAELNQNTSSHVVKNEQTQEDLCVININWE